MHPLTHHAPTPPPTHTHTPPHTHTHPSLAMRALVTERVPEAKLLTDVGTEITFQVRPI